MLKKYMFLLFACSLFAFENTHAGIYSPPSAEEFDRDFSAYLVVGTLLLWGILWVGTHLVEAVQNWSEKQARATTTNKTQNKKSRQKLIARQFIPLSQMSNS